MSTTVHQHPRSVLVANAEICHRKLCSSTVCGSGSLNHEHQGVLLCPTLQGLAVDASEMPLNHGGKSESEARLREEGIGEQIPHPMLGDVHRPAVVPDLLWKRNLALVHGNSFRHKQDDLAVGHKQEEFLRSYAKARMHGRNASCSTETYELPHLARPPKL
jgi:hypothetical protein